MEARQKIGTDSAELESAKQLLALAEAKRKAQADVVARCGDELASKRGLRARLKDRFDECCLEDDAEGARQCQVELDSLDIAIRGCELRLVQGEGDLEKVGKAEGERRAELGRLVRELQLAEEREQITKLIQETERTYLTQHEALQRFNNLMEELKSRSFMDEQNKRLATDAHFRLLSLFNGYGWHKQPDPKSS